MANRYWVGAAGNWNDTARWSTTSGGASGASVPGTADTAIFDANSNTGTTDWTVTVNVSATPGILTLTPDAIVTFATAGNLAVVTSTSLTASSGTTGVIFNGNASLGAVTLTTGTMNINGSAVTMSTLTSTSANTRTFAFGTGGQVTLTGTNTTIWNCSTAGTSAFTGTGTVVCSAAGLAAETRTIVNNHDTGNNLVSFKFTAGADTASFSGTTNINSLDFTGFSGTWANPALTINGSLTLSTGMTVTAGNNTLTFAATTSQTITSNGKTIDRPITFNGVGGTWALQDNFTAGTARTVTLTNGTIDLTGNSGNWTLSTGLFVSNNSNTRSIAFGTGQITLTSSGTTIWDFRTVTGFTYTGTPKVESNYSGATGTRTFRHGDVAGGAESNAVSFYISAGTDIVTTTATAYIRTLNFNGFSGTLSNSARNIYGDLFISSGMTVVGTSATTFAGTSGIQKITTNGATLDIPLTFNGVGGTFQLQDNLTSGSAKTATLTNGTIDLTGNSGNWTLSTGLFVSNNSNVRSITFGTGKILLTGNAGTILSMPTMTNFTRSGSGTFESNYSGATGTRSFAIGNTAGATESNCIGITISAGSDTISLSDGNVFKDLSFQGYTGTWTHGTFNYTIYGDLTWGSGMTISITGAGAFTFASTSGTQKITSNAKQMGQIIINAPGATVQLQDNLTQAATRNTTLTAGTLDLTGNSGNWTLSTNVFSSSNTNTRAVTFGSTGKIQVTGNSTTVWNTGTADNFSYTGSGWVEGSYSGASGTRTFNHGVTSGATESNSISFYISAGTDTIVIGSSTNTSYVKDLNFNNTTATSFFTGQWNIGPLIIYGDYGQPASGTPTLAGTGSITFAATSGTHTININLSTFPNPIIINAPGATYQAVSNIVTSSTFTLTAGTFNANNKNITSTTFASNNSNVRTLTMGSGTWTLSGTGTIWNFATTTNLTFNKDTANIVLSNTSTSARTFAGGGLTYNNLTIGGATGISTLTISGSNTFATLASTKTVAHTITFTAGTTTTVSDWTIKGSSGNIVTLASTTTSAYTLAKSGGGKILMPYMSISYATGSPTTTWYAPASTDGGNNTNIYFTGFPFYWIGGSGTWNNSNTANWSDSSGGSSIGLYPVVGCDVNFDVNSDSGAPFTVTIGDSVECQDLTVSGLDQTMTLDGSSALSTGGSLSVPATNFTNSYTGAITFNATSTGKTITSNGQTFASAITFAGVGGGWTIQDNFTTTSTTTHTNGTLGLGSNTYKTSTFNGSGLLARTIAFGTGQIELTGNNATVLNLSSVTSFTVTGTPYFNSTYSGSTGTRTFNIANQVSLVANGVSNVSTSGTSGIVLGTTATDTVALTGGFGSVDLTGFTATLSNTTRTLYRGLTLPAAGGTFTGGTAITTFSPSLGSGTWSITSNGRTIDWPITISAATGGGTKISLADALTMGSARTLTASTGEFDANNQNVTVGLFSSNNSSTRTITMGSGIWTISGVGTVWDLATITGLTFNKNTANIVLSDTSTSARTFAGGGLTYNDLTIGGTTGTSTLTISGSNTFATLASTKTVAHTIKFTSGTTTTVSDWTITGTSGNVVTINSTVAGSAATLTKSSAGVVSGVNYLSIQDSTATPTLTWYAGPSSTNVSGNTGWIFTFPPSGATGNFFMFFQ